jgi:hypothetical protein
MILNLIILHITILNYSYTFINNYYEIIKKTYHKRGK